MGKVNDLKCVLNSDTGWPPLKRRDLSDFDILRSSSPACPKNLAMSSYVPCHACLNNRAISNGIDMPDTEKTRGQKTLNWKRKQSRKALISLTFRGAICISRVTPTTPISCHRLWHIDYTTTWAISILHAVILKDFKKRFMKTPEWSLPGGLVKASLLLLLLCWDFLGFLRDNGCPLGSVLLHRGCRD